MKWINTAFKCRDTADLCRPWLPFSKSEYEIGVQVVSKHIW